MKKNTYSGLISAWILLLVLSVYVAPAQVTFTEPDSGNNFGIVRPGGLMGAAWGDYDGDGDLDLYICGAAGTTDALYRNDISDSMKFVQVSRNTVDGPGILWDMGGAGTGGSLWADFDGNGELDLIIGTLRIHMNYLKDSSNIVYQQNLLPTTETNGGWGMTAGDFDGDGDVDIASSGGTGGTNGYGPIHVFRNDGNGVYVDVAETMVGATINREAWNPQWVDVDNDGDLDLWMPSIRNGLVEPCYLLINTGTALDLPETGITATSAIMSSWVDYDNDGDMDLYLVPLGTEDTGNPKPKFYQNDGAGHFTDIAPALGLDSTDYAAASDCRHLAWGDYDNDGDQDLLIVRRNSKMPHLWRNDNNGTAFVEVGEGSGLTATAGDVRTTTFVDYDNDGWLDVFVMHNGSALPRLFQNEKGNSNHWIVIKPIDTTKNTAGVGARVTLYAGGKMQIRDIDAGGGNGNNAHLWAHFGLGTATTVDSVIIRFSNGVSVKRTSVAADQYYTIGTVTSVNRNPGEVPSQYTLSQNYPNPFNPATTIEFSLPASGNIRLVLVDMLGRVVQEIAGGAYEAGLHKVRLNASHLATGIYFYRLEAGSFVSTKKLMLIK